MRLLGSSVRAAVLATAAVLVLACSREQAKTNDADLVVARVNGTPISLRDLKEEMAPMQGLSYSTAAKGTASEVSEALRRLLERTLVVQEGRRLGVTVSEAEMEQEIRRYRSDYPPGGLEKILLQRGIGMGEWRARMRQSLLYRKSADRVADRSAEVSENEVREVYRKQAEVPGHPEQIRVRQLIFDSEESALAARRRMRSDSPLGKAVLREAGSEPPPEIVDLGYLSRDDLPGEIAEQLFRLPPGSVSDVVPRDKSFSLFLVVGKRDPRGSSFPEEAPGIREALLRRNREERLRAWIEETMQKADIQVQEMLLEQIGANAR